MDADGPFRSVLVTFPQSLGRNFLVRRQGSTWRSYPEGGITRGTSLSMGPLPRALFRWDTSLRRVLPPGVPPQLLNRYQGVRRPVGQRGSSVFYVGGIRWDSRRRGGVQADSFVSGPRAWMVSPNLGGGTSVFRPEGDGAARVRSSPRGGRPESCGRSRCERSRRPWRRATGRPCRTNRSAATGLP